MNKYDSQNLCPKCLGFATTEWKPLSDRMLRECTRCGYRWEELPNDKKEET